jgi:hypothetical protein
MALDLYFALTYEIWKVAANGTVARIANADLGGASRSRRAPAVPAISGGRPQSPLSASIGVIPACAAA